MNRIDESYYSGETINLDFHTIPHYGENPPLDNHWSGSRNKALKSAYTFIAQGAESRMTNYINVDIKKGEESNIKFLTLRRRGSKLVENAFSLPSDSWKEIKLDIPKRKYNKFKVFEHVINLVKKGLRSGKS